MLYSNDVAFSKVELLHFRQVFPQTEASRLMERLFQKQSDKALKVLTDPLSNIEQIRYAQGVNDAIAGIYNDIRNLLKLDVDALEEELRKAAEAEEDEGLDDQVDEYLG